MRLTGERRSVEACFAPSSEVSLGEERLRRTSRGLPIPTARQHGCDWVRDDGHAVIRFLPRYFARPALQSTDGRSYHALHKRQSHLSSARHCRAIRSSLAQPPLGLAPRWRWGANLDRGMPDHHDSDPRFGTLSDSVSTIVNAVSGGSTHSAGSFGYMSNAAFVTVGGALLKNWTIASHWTGLPFSVAVTRSRRSSSDRQNPLTNLSASMDNTLTAELTAVIVDGCSVIRKTLLPSTLHYAPSLSYGVARHRKRSARAPWWWWIIVFNLR